MLTIVCTRIGCDFFIYGKDTKSGVCYWEKTADASCPEGWEADAYDFYSLNAPGSVACWFDCNACIHTYLHARTHARTLLRVLESEERAVNTHRRCHNHPCRAWPGVTSYMRLLRYPLVACWGSVVLWLALRSLLLFQT